MIKVKKEKNFVFDEALLWRCKKYWITNHNLEKMGRERIFTNEILINIMTDIDDKRNTGQTPTQEENEIYEYLNNQTHFKIY